jgi:hypothetical protein
VSLLEEWRECIGPAASGLRCLPLAQPLERNTRLLEAENRKIGEGFLPGVELDLICWNEFDRLAISVDRRGQITSGMMQVTQAEPRMERTRFATDQIFEIPMRVLVPAVAVMDLCPNVEVLEAIGHLA